MISKWMGPPASDEELARRVREQRDGAAFDQLYARHASRLFAYLYRMLRERELAEDLLQEVFLSVLREGSYVPQPGRFAGWLFTVARNRALRELRDRQRRNTKLQQLERGASPASLVPGAEDALLHQEHLQLVEQALDSLAEPQREALLLRRLGSLSYREIAEIQGVPEGTVKSRLHLAVEALRGLLQASHEEKR